MRILSYNIQGLGSVVKKKEIEEIVSKHKIDFCCIQERKLESVHELDCRALCDILVGLQKLL